MYYNTQPRKYSLDRRVDPSRAGDAVQRMVESLLNLR